jgi:hypothetical protein
MSLLRCRPFAALIACGSLIACLGCGGASKVPVEGRVTLDGKPLVDAAVSLTQLRATDPGPFFATTDAEGRFTLGTAVDVGGGAAPGEYRLTITTVKMTGSGMETDPPPTQKEVVPPNFVNGMQKFTVPAEGTTEANFDLHSR